MPLNCTTQSGRKGMNKIKQKQTHRYKKQISGYHRGRGLVVGKQGEGGQLNGDG